jgi:hypothetical protein
MTLMTPEELTIAHQLSLIQRNLESAQTNLDSAAELLTGVLSWFDSSVNKREAQRPVAPVQDMRMPARAPQYTALPLQPRDEVLSALTQPRKQPSHKKKLGRPLGSPNKATRTELPNLPPFIREYMDELKPGSIFTTREMHDWLMRKKGLTYSVEQVGASLYAYRTKDATSFEKVGTGQFRRYPASS